jgi:hypothetical protein
VRTHVRKRGEALGGSIGTIGGAFVEECPVEALGLADGLGPVGQRATMVDSEAGEHVADATAHGGDTGSP